MLERLTFLALNCLTVVVLVAQPSNEPKEYTSEIGANITTTLAGFFNSGGQDLPKDPFLFSFKLLKPGACWRFGINFSVQHGDEIIGGIQRITREDEFLFRGGLEWRLPVSNRFSLNYGVDCLFNYSFDKTEAQSFNTLTSSERRAGVGIGPFMGVIFHLSNRVSFSTETYAIARYQWGEAHTDIDPRLPPETEDIRRFDLLPAVPNSLYIHFRF